MRVISYSLWGDKPKYIIGAFRNAEQSMLWYGGWECWFWCDEDSCPASEIERLQEYKNVRVIKMRASQSSHWAMFWRFYAAADPNIEAVVFRDTDSRPTQREAMAVDEWLRSEKGFHAMRDHPHHSTPLCGGMWGVKGGLLKDIKERIDAYYAAGLTSKSMFGIDQDFLTHSVWPMAKFNVIEHDEFFAKKPFPLPRDPKHFVGQVYDEKDNQVY